MSEPQHSPPPSTNPPPGGQPTGAAASSDAVPPSPPPVTIAPLHPHDAPPIFEVENDPCPKCGAVLRPGEVVCIKCGFDLRKNQAHAPSVGVELVDAAALERARVQAATGVEPKTPSEEFSTPGRGNLQTLLIFAAALVVSAMVFAGIDSPVVGFWPALLRALLALYKIVLATGAGLVALMVVAHISEMKVGRTDLAAARILLAFSAFYALQAISFPGPPMLVHLLMWTLALGAYWALVKFLFNKPSIVALYLLATHCLLWLVLQGGMSFSQAVQGVEASRARKHVETPEQTTPPQ